jgi:hypothetical protein
MSMVINGTSGITFPDGSLQGIGVGRRNLIINGDFQVSQRGDYTSATSLTNGAYTLDRWTCTNGVGATIQHRSDMPTGEYGKSVKVLTSSGGTLQCALEQRIEVADWMKGKSVTATVWMRSNSSNSSINFYNNIDGFGTPVSHSGNEQWEKLTIQTTFPTGSLTDLRLRIGLSQGGNTSITSGDYFEIAQVQLEVGSVATPFEHRSYGEELALCQRYYQAYGYGLNGATGETTIGSGMFYTAPEGIVLRTLPVVMRTKPTYSSPTVTNGYRFNRAGSTSLVNTLGYFGSSSGVEVMFGSLSVSPNGVSGYATSVYAAQSGAKITLDAEL